MGDYEVGYGKPPKKSRFKPGTSGNPRGRPVRDRTMLGKIVEGMLDAPVQYRESHFARAGGGYRELAEGDLGPVWAVKRRPGRIDRSAVARPSH